MIKITDLISGQSFESIKLTSEYFGIPYNIVKASLDSGLELEFKNKKYRFVSRSRDMRSSSSTAAPIKVFPFGKYKGRLIKDCIDQSYLSWLLEADYVSDRLKRVLRTRFNELKGEKEI